MFKRDMFYKVKQALQYKNVVLLLGPRKCGKTVALTQLHGELHNSEFYNFKTVSDDESVAIVSKIVESIKNNEDIVYLLDEITYMYFVDIELAKIAQLFTTQRLHICNIKTKIVLTGSQSIALESWGRSLFCNEAAFIKSNFLTYKEWLAWRGRSDVSQDSYLAFVKGTFDFYSEFSTLEDYLSGCIDETVISNSKARNYVYGNDCDLVDVDTLVSILYSTLLKLHDRISANNMFRPGLFTDKITYLTKILHLDDTTAKDVIANIGRSVISKYDHVRSMDLETLKQCYAFLIRSDMIVATPTFSGFTDTINVLKQLEASNSLFKTKKDLFNGINFTIKYPMFYVEVLKELFQDKLPVALDGYTLGSVVECHVRGLLPSTGAFEFHDDMDREIDYVCIPNGLAVEIATYDKKIKDVSLDLLPAEYKKILLTESIEDTVGEVLRVPYYKFIYELDEKGSTKPLDSKYSVQKSSNILVLDKADCKFDWR